MGLKIWTKPGQRCADPLFPPKLRKSTANIIAMNTTYRDIRAKLRSMAPQRAIDYIAALDLPGDEAFCIIACDVKQQSRQQVANRLFASVEYVKKRRRNGYQKIADHIKNP